MHSARFRGRAALLSVAAVLILASLPWAAGQSGRTAQAVQSTDPALRLDGFLEYQAMQQRSPFKDAKWQFLGPTNISGRCTDVAVVTPKGANYTIYVATASGGVWKTVNEGTTWTPIFEAQATTSIGDLALDPSNPDVLWVGTGEANIFRSSQAGCGIYKSADAGQTWTHLGLADTNTIGRVIVHPKAPGTVFVAASGHEWTRNPERGVFKTTDGGTTWTKILSVDEKTGASDLVMDPRDPDVLYAVTWERTRKKWNDPRNEPGATGSGVWKTTDGGATWNQVNQGLPEAKFRGRIGVDLCLTKPDTLYALVDNYEIAREPTEEELQDPYGIPSSGFIKGAHVYRSDDGAANWRLVSPTSPEVARLLERQSGTFGWVFGQIRVDPNDPETFYIMGVPLRVSNDGGKSFRTLTGMHSDHHGMWIDPANSDYIINVNDGGIVISYDRGRTWRQNRDNLPVCQFFNVSYDMATPFRVYGSMQDHGSYRGVVNLARGRNMIPAVAFEGAPGGEGSTHAIDPTDPNVIYSSGFYGTLSRTNLATGERKSILPPPYPGEPKLRGQWLAPTILSPHSPDIVYHGMQYLFRSMFRGDAMEPISPDLTWNDPNQRGDIPFQTLFTISESPLKYGLVYAGTDDGRAWVTRNAGEDWQEITPARGPARKWISRMTASAFQLGTVYMSQNGKRDDDFNVYLWKSADFGKTWTDISKGIPVGPVNVIKEDPVDRNILYVGTDMGVYVSTDAGATWNALGSNLPSSYVQDLIVHPRDNIVVAATHGRGMWALDANPVNKKDQRQRRFFDD